MHLVGYGFPVRGSEHVVRVDAVFLGELSARFGDASSVEHRLHGLENVLSMGRCGGIGLLLAIQHHLDDLSKFYWSRGFGLLNLFDPRMAVVCDCGEFR
ncbi:MAG: hypothetical protein ACRDTK_11580, partial [Mycobacterium sp.]